MKQKINNFGFTLLELLLVIAIVGIISSLTVISLNEAKNKAKAAKIAQEIDQMRIAFRIWMDEHGHWLSECEIQNIYDGVNGVDARFCEGGEYPDGSGSCTLSRGCSNDAEPTIRWFITNTSFGEYISDPNAIALEYEYDNDGDDQPVDENGCVPSVKPYLSASFYIQGLDYIERVDKLLDGGDGQICGRFMWSNDSLNRGIWKLGYTVYEF